MDDEESHLSRPAAVRIGLSDTEGVAEEETNRIPSRSPVIGSGLDDSSSTQNDSQQQLNTESNQDEGPSNDGDFMEESNQQENSGAVPGTSLASTAAVPANPKTDSSSNGKNLDDHLQCSVGGDASTEDSAIANSSAELDIKTNLNGGSERENRNRVERVLVSPSFEGDSLSLHDRDPHYATQRPDTLGAINLVPPNATKAFPTVGLKTGARFRASGKDDAPEDMIFDMVQLGRRTRGAGMDQLELNQHQLVVGSDADDGSDSGDAAEPDSNQCESTEADQYKMNPEADQSDSTRPDYPLEPIGAMNRPTRNGPRASGPVRNGRNVERVEERYHSEDDVGNEVDPLGDSELVEEDDQEWQRLNDQDLADRTEDDRQYSISDRPVGGGSGGGSSSGSGGGGGGGGMKAGLPGGWEKEAVRNESSGAAAFDSHHIPPLRQHPNSAFSQLKPDGSGSHTDGNQLTLAVSGSAFGVDRKPVPKAAEMKLNVILPSQDQLMSKPAAVFKPILHESRSSDMNGQRHRTLFPRQYSDGNATDNASGLRFGQNAEQKTLSDNALQRRTDRDDLIFHSPQLLTSNPSFDIGSSESLQGFLPNRADHLMHGEEHFGCVTGLASVSNHPDQHHHHQQQQQLPQQWSGAAVCHPVPMGCDYEPQVTPQKQTRPYHLMEDSLELSPIRPPSSQNSQHHSLGFIQSPGLASVNEAFRTSIDQSSKLHCFGYKTSSEVGSEINDIQQVRSHLHSLLTLSDRTLPDKSHYDQTNDVDDLLTGRAVPSLGFEKPSPWNLMGLHEALPLSSKYLLSGTNQTKLDAAGLAAENRALRDAMEQQRFKRKHCEKQIQQLQNKVMELQQNLAVAVSIDRRKDLTIEQMDKTLVKVAEGWHQKEAEQHETLVYLQKENSSFKQALDSQQQIASRLEMQLSHSVQQLHMEQQRSAQLCLNKDQHISELTSQCQRLQQMIDSERGQWQQKLDNEKQESENLKTKVHLQLEELKSAHEEEVENWKEKEKGYVVKVEQIKETHSKVLELEKTKLEHQEQAYQDLEMVLRASQAEIEQLQMELETMMREKESLKVEISLMEARHTSSIRQLEAELQSSSEKKLSVKLEELNSKHKENDHKRLEAHHQQVEELSKRHLEELEQLKEEHQVAVSELEESFRQHQEINESRVKELEKEVFTLVQEKQKIENHKVRLSSQLQSMMQSHCEEALRLLGFTQPSSNHLLRSYSWSRDLRDTTGNEMRMSGIQENHSSAGDQCSEVIQLSKETGQRQELPSIASRMLPLNGLGSKEINGQGIFEHINQRSASPLSMINTDDAASATAGTQPDSSAQYSLFLNSIRNYQPLLADLNASVASVANSVSTMVHTSQRILPDDSAVDNSEPVSFPEDLMPQTMSAHRVSFLASPVASPVHHHQQQQQQHSSVGSNVYLYSPVLDQKTMMVSQPSLASSDHPLENERSMVTAPHSLAMHNSTNWVDRNVISSDCQQTSLFNQILQHDRTNTSEEMEYMEETEDSTSMEPANHMNNKHHQQEQRQQQLHHYIRMLLQRSPGASSQDDHPVSDAPSANKQLYSIRSDDMESGAGDRQLKSDTRLSSPEQDHDLRPRSKERSHHEPIGAKHWNHRNSDVTLMNHNSESLQPENLPMSQSDEILTQRQLLEISRVLEQCKVMGVNPVVQSSSNSSPPLPMNDLLGCLKTFYEQCSHAASNSNDQTRSLNDLLESSVDAHPKERVLPRNHPSHPINKDLISSNVGGPEGTNVKPEAAKQSKSNKPEPTKPKNTSSASKVSEKKERLPVQRNTNKHAAWK